MNHSVRPRSRPQIDVLENRTLPTTLIALIDVGVDSDSINSKYIDMTDAYNAVDGSNNVTDATGHGTEVSDFIAQEIQSSSNLMGVSPSVEILPIKDWDPTQPGGLEVSSDAIIAGIQYAISKGASVINLSVESTQRQQDTDTRSPYYEEDIATAIQNAQASNSVVVIAAGNDNEDIDQNPVFPAALADYIPNTNALAVTSASSSRSLNAGMNWGQEDVELAAPLPIPRFTDQSTTTSEAAGYISGVVGVLSALNPGASYTTIRNLITQNVEQESGLAGITVTGGMISAYNSLLASPVYSNPTASASPASGTMSQTTLSVNDSYGGGDAGLTYTWNLTSEPSGVTPPSFNPDGKSTTVTFHAAGNYSFQATIADGDGFQRTAPVSVTVNQAATSIAISPASTTVPDGQIQGFAALVDDQFDNPISSPSLAWSVLSGGVGGSINASSGSYTAPSSGAGTDTVKVVSGSASATATVTVTSASTVPLVDRTYGDAGTVTASGGYLPYQGAAKAFDNSVADSWLVQSNTASIEYQFPDDQAYVITQYTITSAADTANYPGRAPKSWIFQGYNGSAWVTLDTQNSQADTIDEDTRTYTFANSTAYNAYQFTSIDSNGDDAIQLAEIRLFGPDPSLVDWARTGGTATAKSWYGTETPQDAFDDSTATDWLDSENSTWIEYQFPDGAAYVVDQYTITGGADTATYSGRAPNSWIFQGSNDGQNWTTLDTQNYQADIANLDTQTYQISNTTAYEDYRLYDLADNGGPGTQLSEIHLYGPSGQFFGQSMMMMSGMTSGQTAGETVASNTPPSRIVPVQVIRAIPANASPSTGPQSARSLLSASKPGTVVKSGPPAVIRMGAVGPFTNSRVSSNPATPSSVAQSISALTPSDLGRVFDDLPFAKRRSLFPARTIRFGSD